MCEATKALIEGRNSGVELLCIRRRSPVDWQAGQLLSGGGLDYWIQDRRQLTGIRESFQCRLRRGDSIDGSIVPLMLSLMVPSMVPSVGSSAIPLTVLAVADS